MYQDLVSVTVTDSSRHLLYGTACCAVDGGVPDRLLCGRRRGRVPAEAGGQGAGGRHGAPAAGAAAADAQGARLLHAGCAACCGGLAPSRQAVAFKTCCALFMSSLPTLRCTKARSLHHFSLHHVQPLIFGSRWYCLAKHMMNCLILSTAWTTLHVTEASAAVGAGEFEKHAGCWMGWPHSPYLWRENAKPAQEQYTAVAKAISQFEPLTMLADPEARPRSAGPTSVCCIVPCHPVARRCAGLYHWSHVTLCGA